MAQTTKTLRFTQSLLHCALTGHRTIPRPSQVSHSLGGLLKRIGPVLVSEKHQTFIHPSIHRKRPTKKEKSCSLTVWCLNTWRGGFLQRSFLLLPDSLSSLTHKQRINRVSVLAVPCGYDECSRNAFQCPQDRQAAEEQTTKGRHCGQNEKSVW